MHPGWLSNAYLVVAEPNGAAVFVDSGAPLEPLLDAVERLGVRPRHILRTHAHPDHVEHEGELRARFGIDVVREGVEVDGLSVVAVPTPGHADDHLAFVVNGQACFSGDLLFRDAVGGGDAATVRESVMERVMTLPGATRVYPGHTDETTIGREWEQNPFVRVWRRLDPEGTEPCRVGGRPATLVVWSPDYDGKGKALVRFEEGGEAIVGGSRVERV